MRKYVASLIISFFLVMFGIFLTISEVLNFKIVDKFDNNVLAKYTKTYDIEIAKPKIEINASQTNEPTVVYDNTLEKGKMKLVVTYYNEIMDIDKYVLVNDDTDVLYVDIDEIEEFRTVKKLIEVTIEGLKEDTIYNYEKAIRPDLNVIINEADKDVVKIRN